MEKMLKHGWVVVLVIALALPATVVRAGDDDEEDETTTSESSNGGRKLSGAEDGAEDEAVAEKTDDSGEEATTASNEESSQAPAEEKDARGEKLFKKLKGLVKQFDKRTKPYPSPLIESAIRNEFLRQAEGKRDFAWLRGKNLEGGDRTVAQDNFELFLNYAEKLGNAKPKAKDADLLVVKGLIDRYGRRGIAANEPPEGLGKNGRAELKRQYALLGRLVSGPGYEPLKFAKLEDAAKAYKARLVSARGEFDKLASTMGGSKKVVKRKEATEGGDRKPASTKGKKGKDGGKDKSKAKKKKK